jgi:hypothetical protein
MVKTQVEAVIEFMTKNGGFATLAQLYKYVPKIDGVHWNTKTPDASIRRIVQDKKRFLKIKPGLYSMVDYINHLPEHIKDLMQINSEQRDKNPSLHYYYQGILVEMGNIKGFATYVPPQDKNKNYINSTLGQISSIKILPKFTYEDIISRIKTVDVIWLDTLLDTGDSYFPTDVFEVENTTDFKNSLGKFYELRQFNTNMVIVAPSNKKKKFEDIINLNIYRQIKSRVTFWEYEKVETVYQKIINSQDNVVLKRLINH